MADSAWIPDASAISAFRENPEGFRLRYRLHLVPATPDDKMQAGSAVHAALDALRRGKSVEAAVAAARAVRGEAEGARNAAHVERVVRAYAVRYPAESEPFEVVQSERYEEGRISAALDCAWPSCVHPKCNCALTGPPASFDYCGIMDSVVRFSDGTEYVMDTKSTGAYLNDQWQETMRLSDQLVGYVALRRARGERCDGFFVDGVRFNDYVPKGGGTPNVDAVRDFARVGPVAVAEWRVQRWARDMRYTLARIAKLDSERGPNIAWPMYQNWPYGKVGAYVEFYGEPSELHASVAQRFERKVWSPRQVAEERAAAVVRVTP